ncbi:DNA damage-inducible transcript 3 protein isoform X1 [Chelonia mydas]|uniref:DNA damage-inducible transcript 3 protein isoform X1 n=1 Tax=Chelonia mydas TaxID=8469 RepID=UPI0018A1D0E0|nr:DNA damage-inducible transcript 3 protein isoform X1 [Chelonia mydas]XP_037740173.1 DNA damage-inducible transcript 3 protein isoform X1 [Chelonia mydas]
MAAEPVPASLPSWELEAWYEDLQEVLSSDENGGTSLPPGGVEQKDLATLDATALLWGLDFPAPLVESTGDAPGSCELDASLTSELLELLSGTAEELAGLPESDSSQSSPAQTCTEDEEGAGPACGLKRKRSSQPQGQGKKRSREKEQNERRVTELMAENERLKQEIERLSAEVEATRAALIERMVNLQKV